MCLGPENGSIDYQLCEADVLRQPYEVLAKILYGMLEVNREAKKKYKWNALVTQVDDLAN